MPRLPSGQVRKNSRNHSNLPKMRSNVRAKPFDPPPGSPDLSPIVCHHPPSSILDSSPPPATLRAHKAPASILPLPAGLGIPVFYFCATFTKAVSHHFAGHVAPQTTGMSARKNCPGSCSHLPAGRFCKPSERATGEARRPYFLPSILRSSPLSLTVGSASFSDPNAGTNKAVTATGLALTGSAAGNYVLASTTATTTANITAKVVVAGSNRIAAGFREHTINRIVG
ncbi:MAG TPA: YDG domain-containing protein [Planctomycetaceae bacterium]